MNKRFEKWGTTEIIQDKRYARSLEKICDYMNENFDKITDLEAKLAEYEKFMKGNKFNDIQDVQNAINGIFQDTFDEKHKIWISICDRLAKCEQENKQLKQQLAEKDEEIEIVKNLKADEMALKVIQKHNQDKIELLEKVESYIQDCTYIKEPDYTNICEYIDTLIKEIKGE